MGCVTQSATEWGEMRILDYVFIRHSVFESIVFCFNVRLSLCCVVQLMGYRYDASRHSKVVWCNADHWLERVDVEPSLILQ